MAHVELYDCTMDQLMHATLPPEDRAARVPWSQLALWRKVLYLVASERFWSKHHG